MPELPMGTPGNVDQFAFVQTSPGLPVPAAVGPNANPTPVSPLALTEPTVSKLVPATPLPFGTPT